jgi:hypothetical protein
LPLDLSFLEEGFGLLKVGLLSFIHSLHWFQLFFCILEALLQLTLGLIALTVLLFSFSQEFPHTTHNSKCTGRYPSKVSSPGRSAASSSSPFGLFFDWWLLCREMNVSEAPGCRLFICCFAICNSVRKLELFLECSSDII